MTLIDPADARPIHFIGIAGAGMSALAELFLRRGVRVTGCDSAPSAGFATDLARLGLPVWAGHDPGHVERARAVVVTSAVNANLPELARARELAIPVVRRAEALGEAVRGAELVAIAGTHGKTTTTAMTTEALAAAGLEPTGIAGGRVAAWNGNLRYASDRVFVAEADEYDRSFLALEPTVAVVTNVEADHLDIYQNLDEIKRAFEQFVRPARAIVSCADDPGADDLIFETGADVFRYGITDRARVAATRIRHEDGKTTFAVVFDGEAIGDVALRVPGLHNVRNALAAIASGLALGTTLDAMRSGLEGFSGVERRFQRLGTSAGVEVIDDYAHHPTEIAATLDAARTAFPGRRLVVAFQPHLFSRTRDFAEEFGQALAKADAIFLAEIYAAREQPIPGVTASLIEESCRGAGRPITWRGDRSVVAGALAGFVRAGDVVITAGAGDITRTGPELLHRLASRT
ncbi:MAG: UDP-N-acetylmuramate--L-alanine ligase [Gemmatimonadaceae bacterium]|nr:UDP-N-acetylmuramate--L-alanine ligase [Gemmatimonadaceae bacterium]